MLPFLKKANFQRLLTRLLLLLPIAMHLGCSAYQPAIAFDQAERLVIHGASLVAHSDAEIVSDSYVIIEDGVISAIGTGNVSAKASDLRINAKGLVISPGLIDMHVHVFDSSDLLLLLAHGVTSVRHMSGEPKLLAFKKAVAEGELLGPDLVVASPVLNQRSRYVSGSSHRLLTGPEHGRRLVKKYSRMGYDLIKVYDGLRLPTYQAITAQAQDEGLPVAGHPSFMFALRDFTSPALQSLEHSEMLYQAFLDYSYSSDKLETLLGTIDGRPFVTPTLIVWDDLAQLAAGSEQVDEELLQALVNPHLFSHVQPMIEEVKHLQLGEQWLRKSQELQQVTLWLHDHGYPLLVGSDSGYVTLSGFGTIDEMVLLRDAGINSRDVHRFATINGAEALGISKKIGRLQVGMQADLVLTVEDPRRAIELYRNLQGVVKSGRYFNADAVRAMKAGAKQHMGKLATLKWYLSDRIQQLLDWMGGYK